jgi:hypothetical protein
VIRFGTPLPFHGFSFSCSSNLSIGYPIFAREVTAMPIKVLNAVETAAAEVLLESDMRFLMEDVGLRHDVSLVFAHFGFGRMRRFAGLEDTKDKVRAVLIADFGIDPAAGLQQRGDIADLLSCWDASRLQLERENQLRADNRVNAIQTAASPLEVRGMLKAVEHKGEKVETRLIPGRYLLGKKLEEIQANEPEVEKLSEIVSRLDGDEEFITTEIGKDGRISVKKGSKREVPSPRSPEELRTCYRLLTNAWIFVATRHPGRSWMVDFDEHTYSRLADYLLGPKVMSLRATTDPDKPDEGPMPSWSVVLNYDYEIRKEAYEEVRSEGKTLDGAIKSVIRNQELRSLQFLTPFSFQQKTQRPSNQANSVPPPNGGSWERPPKKDKKDKKGKDGKDGKGRDRWNINTPDGRVICKKWNTKNVGCEGGCGLVHCCQVCVQTSHRTHEHITGFVTDRAKTVAAKRQKKGM